MLPEITLLPSLRISTWGLMVFFAGLAVLWLGRVNAPARGVSPALVERLWPWLLIGGFIGAHLNYLLAVAGWPLHRLPLGAVLDIFDGTAVQGGILGGIGAAAVFLRRRGQPFLPVCDALAPGGALAQGIARAGCFLAGCCYGRRTNLFLGVVYASPLADPETPRGIPLHPAQLYETLFDVCLAVFLQRQLRASRRLGTVFAFYLMGAGAIRFAVQFFRDDDSGRLTFGLAHSQFMAVGLFAAAAAIYKRFQREVLL